MGRRKAPPGQLPLDDAAPRTKGTVERAAEADLRELRRESTIPTGMTAVAAAFRLTAREIDRAEREQDRWGKLNAARELRALRERLGVVAPAAGGGEADAFWESMSTPVRDTPEP